MDELRIEIGFGELEAALFRPSFKPPPGKAGKVLSVESRPQPFVSPKLYQLGSPKNLTTEVVLIQAPAAVGKTTMARCLSASRAVPFLNLAYVPVSTGSLKALISDLVGPGDPVSAFHQGELPIIIDALDEGRMLSGDTGLESFLSTTAEFLLADRRVTNRPKLVIFGRTDIAEIAKVWLEVESKGGITVCLLDVAFFEEQEARALIHEYAKLAADPKSQYARNPTAVEEVITTYFHAIEAALGLEPGELWKAERGRVFAGYAPVLAAVGSLLSELESYAEVVKLLRDTGVQEAWQVIEKVLQAILDRDQAKLCSQLAPQVSVPLPPKTYDREEQLTLLTRYVHGRPLEGTGRIAMSPQDRTKYDLMVKQALDDHPFVRNREFRDPVMGALVLAFAVARDLLTDVDLTRLQDASRQPFLWRSLRPQLTTDYIDGRYVGCILSSFWNDPLTTDPAVIVRSPEDEGAEIRVVSYLGQEASVLAIMPLQLEGQIKKFDAKVSGLIRLNGRAPRNSRGRVFDVYGPTAITCGSMEIESETMTLQGDVWFEAGKVSAPPNLDVRIRNGGTKVGWGGQLAKTYPWSQIPPTLQPPPTKQDRVGLLIDECCERLQGVLTLREDYTPPEDDAYTRWASRRFPQEFPKLINVLIRKGLASPTGMTASGTKKKVHVRLTKTWPQLRDLLNGGTPEGQALLAELRDALR